MLTSGDVLEVDLGLPIGSEAGPLRPVVVLTAQRVLDRGPNVVYVVPLTSTLRRSTTEVVLPAEPANGLTHDSAAQCQHLRAVAVSRIRSQRGNVGPTALAQLREIVGLLLDL